MASCQIQGTQPGPCTIGLDQELQGKCMDTNNISYNGTIFIISNNRTGSLPSGYSYEEFRNLMCAPEKQNSLTPCILQLMQHWNKTSCSQGDRIMMTVNGGQLLGLMEGFCQPRCLGEATQTMIQCFAAVQIDPSMILNQNASIATDKFSFVGNDTNSALAFCNSRRQLFSCLSPLISVCQPLLDRLYTLGIDFLGLEKGTQYLCEDVDEYVKTYQCFSRPSNAMKLCNEKVTSQLSQVQTDRYRTGLVKPSEYQGHLCRAKLSHVNCDVKSLLDDCGPKAVKTLTTFECSAMPKPCVEEKEAYKILCNEITTQSPVNTKRPTPPTDTSNPSKNFDITVKHMDKSGSYVLIANKNVCYVVFMFILMALFRE